jgi:uncharacterized membrane protein
VAGIVGGLTIGWGVLAAQGLPALAVLAALWIQSKGT